MKCFMGDEPATHILRVNDGGTYTVHVDLCACIKHLDEAENVLKRRAGVAEDDLLETVINGLERLRIPTTDVLWQRLYDPVGYSDAQSAKLMANCPPPSVLETLTDATLAVLLAKLPADARKDVDDEIARRTQRAVESRS